LSHRAGINLAAILPSVVLVGVWNPVTKSFVNLGSGFIIDATLGLVVTAGHVLFEMKDRNSATPYDGRPIIAVVPDAADGGTQATFRYFAEVVAHNVPFVDACVVRISSRINTNDAKRIDQHEQPIDVSCMSEERLRSLPMTTQYQREQAVRITGFPQDGRRISLSVDVVSGYICSPIEFFKTEPKTNRLVSTSVIATTCATMGGQSGGPCVTSQGQVVGILSSRDPEGMWCRRWKSNLWLTKRGP
jgi:V8-like Glu-specific endopeptidase